jgi:hypothetical protein
MVCVAAAYCIQLSKLSVNIQPRLPRAVLYSHHTYPSSFNEIYGWPITFGWENGASELVGHHAANSDGGRFASAPPGELGPQSAQERQHLRI